MNFLRDLLSFSDLFTYLISSYPDKLILLKDRLDLKLKEDPEYEVFVPFIYFKSSLFKGRVSKNFIITPSNTFISNKGRVIRIGNKEIIELIPFIGKNKYYRINVYLSVNKPVKVLFHRALACAFIPLPKDLIETNFEELEVNHVNGVKIYNVLDNLEWVTGQGNKDHAMLNELIQSGIKHYRVKPVKGIVVKGDFKGYEFLLLGSKDIRKNGFSKVCVSRACLGYLETHKNCSFSFAVKNDISRLSNGLPKEIRDNVNATHTRVLSYILMVNLITKKELVIKGGKSELISLGFDESAVSKVIKGKMKSHKGCAFTRIQP